MATAGGPLILTPTAGERDAIQQSFAAGDAQAVPAWAASIQLCGFGQVVAAARTSQLIAEHRPSEVWLLGIAGVYAQHVDAVPIGSAAAFGTVFCYGIGVGEGRSYQSSGAMGFHQWPYSNPPIGDRIDQQFEPTPSQQRLGRVDQQWARRGLLSVCSAAANREEAETRQQAFPESIAEEMEGMGVAAACQLASVPWTIVRGISNVAGDRDHQRWQIKPALEAVVQLVDSLALTSKP